MVVAINRCTALRCNSLGFYFIISHFMGVKFLNDELREVFRKWYPHFTQGDENQRKAA